MDQQDCDSLEGTGFFLRTPLCLIELKAQNKQKESEDYYA